MTKKKWLAQFLKLSNHAANVEIALLNAIPDLYTREYGNKMVLRKVWKGKVLADLDASVRVAYRESRPVKILSRLIVAMRTLLEYIVVIPMVMFVITVDFVAGIRDRLARR